MKAIMISDHAKWCALMMNGDKTIEVRTSKALAKATQKLIDKYGFAEFYVYCTKGSHQLVKPKDYDKYLLFTKGAVDYSREHTLNGKVLFKFRCYKVEDIEYLADDYCTEDFRQKELIRRCCLTDSELNDYLNHKTGYAIHISDLVIFDKPKKISEFKRWVIYKKCENCPYGKCDNYYGLCSQCCEIKPLTKAPQSFCYIEVEDLL